MKQRSTAIQNQLWKLYPVDVREQSKTGGWAPAAVVSAHDRRGYFIVHSLMNAEQTPAAGARFTLHPGHWYAAEFIGDEFSAERDFRSHSPIRVDSVERGRTGKRHFQLSFYHANYPQGVQSKVYSLQTLERGEQYILARSVGYEPARLLMIYGISWPWLRSDFNAQQPLDSEDIEPWLSSNA